MSWKEAHKEHGDEFHDSIGIVKEEDYFYCQVEKGEYIPMAGISKSQNKEMKKMHEAIFWRAFVRVSEIENVDEDFEDH